MRCCENRGILLVLSFTFWAYKKAYELCHIHKSQVTTKLLLFSEFVCVFSYCGLLTHANLLRETKRGKMTSENGFTKVLQKFKPYLAMVSLQFGYAGMYIITMVSFKHGMSHWVLSVYRHIIAFCFMAPFALVLERSLSLSLSHTHPTPLN